MRSIVAVLLLAFASHAGATTFYVDAVDGDDTRDGLSPATAWKTLVQANFNFSHKAGDTILFHGGQTFVGGLTISADFFPPTGADVTLGSYGGGRATISQTGRTFALSVSGVDRIHISDLILRGPGAALSDLPGLALSMAEPKNVAGGVIERLEISGFDTGILVTVPPDGFWDGLVIDSVVSHDNSEAGIEVAARTGNTGRDNRMRNLRISRSTIYRNVGGSTNTNTGGNGNGIFLYGVDGATIEGNTSFDNGGINPCNGTSLVGPFAINAYGDHLAIRGNEAYRQHLHPTCTADNGGFHLNGSNCVLEGNYTHDNDGIGLLIDSYPGNHSNVIRSNVSENDSGKTEQGLLWITGNISDYEISHNTLYSNNSEVRRGPAIHVDGTDLSVDLSQYSKVHFRNNLVIVTQGTTLLDVVDPQKAFDLTFDNDAYVTPESSGLVRWDGHVYYTMAALAEEQHQEEHGRQLADAQVCSAGGAGTLYPLPLTSMTAYRLRPGSPLIGAGANVAGAAPARDLRGLPENVPADIGAFSYLPGEGCLAGGRRRATRH